MSEVPEPTNEGSHIPTSKPSPELAITFLPQSCSIDLRKPVQKVFGGLPHVQEVMASSVDNHSTSVSASLGCDSSAADLNEEVDQLFGHLARQGS